MTLLRFLLPSFEKPVDRPRFIHIEPEGYDFRGIGTVLILAASCGVAIALWDPSYQVTSSREVTSPTVAASSLATTKVNAPQTTASADDEDDDPAPAVRLSSQCSRATARRDCAKEKAMKEARLKATEPNAPARAAVVATVPAAAPVAVFSASPIKEIQPAAVAAKASADAAEPAPAVIQPVSAPAVQPQRAAAAPKAKRPRVVEDGSVERLVKVYDQILPDGRRVPVYRRVGGSGLETGTIVDREYRPARRANLELPFGRYFGLQ